MLIQLTEEQKMLRDMAREFTKNEIEPRDRWMDDNGFDWDLYRKIAAGWRRRLRRWCASRSG